MFPVNGRPREMKMPGLSSRVWKIMNTDYFIMDFINLAFVLALIGIYHVLVFPSWNKKIFNASFDFTRAYSEEILGF